MNKLYFFAKLKCDPYFLEGKAIKAKNAKYGRHFFKRSVLPKNVKTGAWKLKQITHDTNYVEKCFLKLTLLQ